MITEGRFHTRATSAFSLIELAVMIVTLILFVLFLVFGVRATKREALRKNCVNNLNLKSIGIAYRTWSLNGADYPQTVEASFGGSKEWIEDAQPRDRAFESQSHGRAAIGKLILSQPRSFLLDAAGLGGFVIS